MKTKLTTILNSYSDIFFIRGVYPGLILLLLSFFNPYCAIGGLLAVLSAYYFATFIGYSATFLSSGFYTYNALLVGFSIGVTFKLTALTLMLIFSAGILTFVFTIVFSHLFSQYLKLQILSLPFVAVSSLVYLALGRYSHLYIEGLYQKTFSYDWSYFYPCVNAFFKSMGNIIFMPNVIIGIFISLLILYASRILFSLAVLGFTLGSVVQGLYVGSMTLGFTQPYNFNFILIAMAIGGIYLIPSIQSYIVAMIGVVVSTVLISGLDVFWAHFSLPIFTLPFIIVTLSFVYVLGLINYRLRPTVHKATPEETLDYFLTTQARFPQDLTIRLPFYERWTVWQEFNGQWTHQGLWRYAYDFVQTDSEHKTYTHKGARLDDYYCFKKPVLSPLYGQVTKVVAHVPDNPVGSVDMTQNWGNHVLIRHANGHVVELSHFFQHSIVVKEGDWVSQGSLIGLCGNSGYSAQPHLHIQVQWSAEQVSPPIPFAFGSYIQKGHYQDSGLPKVSDCVYGMPAMPFYDQLTHFILGHSADYSVYKRGKKIQDVTLTIGMADDGTFYFSTPRAKLYFGKRDGLFMMYHMENYDPFLKILYLALPKMPLYYEPGLTWTDILPSTVYLRHYKKWLSSWLTALFPSKLTTVGTYTFQSETEITGKIRHRFFKRSHTTSVVLDPHIQFKHIRYKHFEIKKTP